MDSSSSFFHQQAVTSLGSLASAASLAFGIMIGLLQSSPLLAASEAAGMRPVEAKKIQLAEETGSKKNLEIVPDNSTTKRTTTYGGWTVNCSETIEPPEKLCSASFRIVDKQKNSNILVWLFGRNAKEKPLSEFLTLTDVLIEPGVVLTLDDGKPLRAGYVYCSSSGCKASIDLTKSLIQRLKTAKKAKVEVTCLDGKVIQFAMEIPGIDRALTDIGF